MTSPVNTTFTSGTTITSNWLNGANDHVNDLEPNAHIASNITNVPNSYVTSTNVQAAINELSTYNEGSTGAVDRSVTSKLQESVSVKDFGAVGDGVTDDTAAVQAALDDAWLRALNLNATGGVSLYFPAGNYKCGALRYGSTTPPPGRPSRIYIYGEHGASVIKSTVTTGQIALNFTLYAGMSNFGGNTIENMMFQSVNYQGTGLHFEATNWMTRVSGCIFQGFEYNYYNRSGITTTVENSFFLSAQIWNFYMGVGVTGLPGYDEVPANMRFQNNYVGQGIDPSDGHVVYSQKGIGGTDAYGLGAANAIVTNNVFEGCIDYAIYMGKSDGSTSSFNNIIDGNWFESPGYPTTKDQIYGAFYGSRVSNNTSGQNLLVSPGLSTTLGYDNIIIGNNDRLYNVINFRRNMVGMFDTYTAQIGAYDVGVDFTGVAIGKKSPSSLIDSNAYPLLVFIDGVAKWYLNGIGQTTMIGTAATEGQIYLRNDGTTTGKQWHIGANSGNYFVVYNQNATGVYMTDGGTSWTANSDERTKDIIEPIENATEKVSSLRAVIGKYKNDEEGTRRSFLIAQDVQAVLPEAVNVQQDEQGTLGLQYTDVIPLLVAAIKELKAEVDILKSK